MERTRCPYCDGRYLTTPALRVLRPHNCAGDPSRPYDWAKPHGHEYLEDPQAPGYDANGAPTP